MTTTTTTEKEALSAVTALLADLLHIPDGLRGPMLRGTLVTKFEKLLARHWGFSHALSMSNATTGLLTVALSEGLRGQEIIAAPRSWTGTYAPFELAGAGIVKGAADRWGNLDPACLPDLLNENTAAVLLTDWNNQPHDSCSIRRFCNENGLLYLVDSSSPPTSEVRPDAQIVSFGPGKPLCLGEGGAILTNHTPLFQRALRFSQHPERIDAEYLPPCDGPYAYAINGRMPPITAALGAAILSDAIKA